MLRRKLQYIYFVDKSQKGVAITNNLLYNKSTPALKYLETRPEKRGQTKRKSAVRPVQNPPTNS